VAISNRAAQQVAALLVQGGLPSGHAADVAQRLVSAGAGGSTSRLSNARTWGREEFISAGPTLRNAFNPPETPDAPSAAGTAGADGLPGANGWGWGGPAGADGAVGENGLNGQDGFIEQIITVIGGGGGGFDQRLLTPLWDAIFELRRRLVDDSKWRKQVESVLKAQANMLKKLRDKDKEHDKKLKALDKDLDDLYRKVSRLSADVSGLRNRVEEIEKYLPPEECGGSSSP